MTNKDDVKIVENIDQLFEFESIGQDEKYQRVVTKTVADQIDRILGLSASSANK